MRNLNKNEFKLWYSRARETASQIGKEKAFQSWKERFGSLATATGNPAWPTWLADHRASQRSWLVDNVIQLNAGAGVGFARSK